MLSWQTKQNAKVVGSMYILTQSGSLENIRDTVYQVHNADLERSYLESGYHQNERIYNLKAHHKEFVIVCPEFRKSGTAPIVLIPDFLIPGRPYPIYVYMYAIEIYSSSPEKGQRFAAEATRKQFGLTSFAHTTLGRALKSLIRSISEPVDIQEEQVDIAHSTAVIFPTVHSTAVIRKEALSFLRKLSSSWANLQEKLNAFCKLAKHHFIAHSRFLL